MLVDNYTYNFIFRIYQKLNFDESLSRAINNFKPTGSWDSVRHFAVYLYDEHDVPADIADSYLYIEVSSKTYEFERNINIIRNSNIYVEDYVSDIDRIIIKINYPFIATKKKFLNSQYSQMYSPQLLKSSKVIEALMDTNTNTLSKYYGILSKSEDYFNTNIRPLLYRPSIELIDTIKGNEYIDVLKLDREIKIKNINYDVSKSQVIEEIS